MTATIDYDSYINSEIWRNKANHIRERDGGRCQICGANDVPLEVHHLTYARLYHELDDDLITLCDSCHKKVTDSWHSINSGIKARDSFLRRLQLLQHSYEHVKEQAQYLTCMMPYDISFGGKYTLSNYDEFKKACTEEGIKYKHAMIVQEVFNRIHVLDVVTQICSGVPKWKLIEDGYPKSLVRDITNRKEKNEDVVTAVSDELVCYMHDGVGEWVVVTTDEDSLKKGFTVRFMPYKRYQTKWWDS